MTNFMYYYVLFRKTKKSKSKYFCWEIVLLKNKYRIKFYVYIYYKKRL